jgi:L-glutamine-phosphate cytidylyltransferase
VATDFVILAAGTGSRLQALTRHAPKSLLDLGDGRPVLERQISGAAAAGFERVLVVTGYRSEMIERFVADLKPGIRVTTVFNPVYEVSNNLVSLWFALPLVRDRDFVISNGDNLYAPEVLPKLAAADSGIWLTIDRRPEYEEEDMKVQFAEDGRVERVSKQVASPDAGAESVGLVLVRGEPYRRAFVSEVDALLHNSEYVSRFWLEAITALCNRGIIVRTLEIAPDQWAEIDFHPDVRRLRHEVMAKAAWTQS